VAKPVKGEVVVVPFPFSNLGAAKRRPALVMADLDGDDLILAQITSVGRQDRYAIQIDTTDFSVGSLHVASTVRPNRLFTADASIVLYSVGRLQDKAMRRITDELIRILNQ